MAVAILEAVVVAVILEIETVDQEVVQEVMTVEVDLVVEIEEEDSLIDYNRF